MKKTKREKLEERERKILLAAHDAFVDYGFKGSRITDIAKNAGVAEGTIYLYFHNKNALLQAVIERFYSKLTKNAVLGVKTIPDVMGKLEFLGQHHLKSCLEEWKLLELSTSLYRRMPDYQSGGYYKLNKIYVEVFDGVIQDGINQGFINSKLPIPILRDFFYGSLEYSARTLVFNNKLNEQEVVIENLLNVLKVGVISNDLNKIDSKKLLQISKQLDSVKHLLKT